LQVQIVRKFPFFAKAVSESKASASAHFFFSFQIARLRKNCLQIAEKCISTSPPSSRMANGNQGIQFPEKEKRNYGGSSFYTKNKWTLTCARKGFFLPPSAVVEKIAAVKRTVKMLLTTTCPSLAILTRSERALVTVTYFLYWVVVRHDLVFFHFVEVQI